MYPSDSDSDTQSCIHSDVEDLDLGLKELLLDVAEFTALDHLPDNDMQGIRTPGIQRIWDEINRLTGFDDAKKFFQDLEQEAIIANRQNVKMKLRTQDFHMKLIGNPGTGKYTVANLYARFLAEIGVVDSPSLVEKSGPMLAARDIDSISERGVLFISNAHLLNSDIFPQGQRVLEIIQSHINIENTCVFIFAGNIDGMQSFDSPSLGLSSKIKRVLHLADFSNDLLLKTMKNKISQRYNGKMKIEGHPEEDIMDPCRYLSIITNRIGLRRGTPGFSNGIAVEKEFQQIISRQAKRISYLPEDEKEDMLLTKDDILGPVQTKDIFNTDAWKSLKDLVGLDSVKDHIMNLVADVESNIQREIAGLKPIKHCLNRVFLGNPGTGKTTVARYYGRILADLGLLSNGEVIVKTPSNFIGKYLGYSEAQTKAILSSAIGKVLIIDEAYGLDPGDQETGQQHRYRAGIVDGLVSNISGVAGDDQCVIMLGYEPQMDALFKNANPGLRRRFNYSNPIRFENYKRDELMRIMDLNMKEQQLTCSSEGLNIADGVLSRELGNPGFSNAASVEILLGDAISKRDLRLKKFPSESKELQPEDFDPQYGKKMELNTKSCKQVMAGHLSDAVISQLEQLRKGAFTAKKSGTDWLDQVLMNFAFVGNRGTGKSSAARYIGSMYAAIGILSSGDVVECSSSDLIGQHSGETRHKTKQTLKRGLGKVMLIDNASEILYRYTNEVFGTIVDEMESSAFSRNMVFIFGVNVSGLAIIHSQGFGSFLKNRLTFDNLTACDCVSILQRELSNLGVSAPFLEDDNVSSREALIEKFHLLSTSSIWGNFHSIMSIATDLRNEYASASSDLIQPNNIPGQQIMAHLQKQIDGINKITELSSNPNIQLDGKVSKSDGIGPIMVELTQNEHWILLVLRIIWSWSLGMLPKIKS